MRQATSLDHSSDWFPAPIPANESERIAALRAIDILDTAEEDVYNTIVKAAAQVCQTPIAFIGFIDSDRQWLKSRVGIDVRETRRDTSFCGHTVAGEGPLLIPDTQLDPRFRSNPFVLASPYIRFYAGIPLRTCEGSAVGTLCVVDTEPRVLGPGQLEALQQLATSLTRILQLRQRIGSSVFARAIDVASDGVTIAASEVQGDLSIVYANDGFLKLTGASYLGVINQAPVFPAGEDCPEVSLACKRAIEDSKMATVDAQIQSKDGEKRWVRYSFIPYIDIHGKLTYLATVLRDITNQRDAEAQTNHLYAMRTTLATITHLVNNFLNSAQLYAMQVNAKTPQDPQFQQAFVAALERTRAQLATLNRMPAFRDRPTPFGFSLLDPDDSR